MKFLILVILILTLLYACSSAPRLPENRTAHQYFSHMKITPATSHVDVREAFGKIFSDFKTGATESNIRTVYADQLYFNDTFKIIENIDELVVYMSESAAHVNSTEVDILDVIETDDDYFVRWSMTMDLTVKGKNINSFSIGMTQLRFNTQGKVVFHQDFWDSSEAFYEHLPFLGSIVKKVKSML